MPSTKITIIDCRSYNEASRRNRKRVEIDAVVDAIKDQVVHSDISRYEVLGSRYLRPFFDIEKVPDEQTFDNLVCEFSTFFRTNVLNIRLPDEHTFEEGINIISDDAVKSLIRHERWSAITPEQKEVMKKELTDKGWSDAAVAEFVATRPIKMAITFNPSSANHKGLSFHLILPEYKMMMNTIKFVVLSFTNEYERGKQFKPYMDIRVYTQDRLFKLPYYVGITTKNDDKTAGSRGGTIDTNTSNHHRIENRWATTTDPFDYIIQNVCAIEKITGFGKQIQSSWDQTAAKISPKDGEKKQVTPSSSGNVDSIINALVASKTRQAKRIKATFQSKFDFVKKHIGEIEPFYSTLIDSINEENAMSYNVVSAIYKKLKSKLGFGIADDDDDDDDK